MASARRPEIASVLMSSGRSARRVPNDVSALPSLSTLITWYDAQDINGNGDHNAGFTTLDPVATWVNKGAGGATYNQIEGTLNLKPTYTTNRLNGHPGVVYDTGDFLKSNTNPHVTSAARYIIGVITVPAISGYWYLPANGAGYDIVVGNNNGLIVISGGNISQIAAAPATGASIIMEVGFSGVTTALPTCTINGVAQTVTQFAGTGVGAESATAGLRLGEGFNEAIFEVMSWTSVLSAGEAAQARGIASAKWGIAVS